MLADFQICISVPLILEINSFYRNFLYLTPMDTGCKLNDDVQNFSERLMYVQFISCVQGVPFYEKS